jgi:hypothetical protein
MPDNAVRRILDRPIRLDMSDDPVGFVLYRSVGLDMGDHPVQGVLHLLRPGSRRRQRQQQNETNDFPHALFYAKIAPKAPGNR